MHRRSFLKMATSAGFCGLAASCNWQLREGMFNSCEPLREFNEEERELFGEALEGLDFHRVWDTHVHLVGVGDSNSGIRINRRFQQFWRPGWKMRYHSYLNAACLGDLGTGIDTAYVQQLLRLMEQFPAGAKSMLIAFDEHYKEDGQADPERTIFHIPNEYAAHIAARHPDRFEWIASIHPYREDCLEALEQAVAQGARCIKWLPQAMGMDPASPLCDRFYERAATLGIPLLIHVGSEHAIPVPEQTLGNPLRLRRALDHGVRVIAAHCARKRENVDLDRGPNGPTVSSFSLFSRLMETPDYEHLLMGDISSIYFPLYDDAPAQAVLEREEWHPRLLYASDYPLPAMLPMITNTHYVELNMLKERESNALVRVRRYNPMLYNFLLIRLLRYNNKRFAPEVFHTRDHFLPTQATWANSPWARRYSRLYVSHGKTSPQ